MERLGGAVGHNSGASLVSGAHKET